jgi:hypothetical protein
LEPISVLEVGQKYSKKDLASLIDEPRLLNVREGVSSCDNSDSYLLFVDLEKEDKEKRFHFDDFFEEDFFHWDSQTTQHIESPKIQEVVTGSVVTYLFVRVKQKEKSKTLPFIYCGRVKYVSHEKGTNKPVHLLFQNIDYDDFTDNLDLLEVYRWKPSDAGMTTKSKISRTGSVSDERKRKYKKPEQTERKGLVTSRVGQGYYRQQVINKWKGKCPLTGIDALPILISSHIVPWSESNDDERLDVENGILLSPNLDALFDRHLISFDDFGEILISSKVSEKNIENLKLLSLPNIEINERMLKYIRRHRNKFLEIQRGKGTNQK